VVHENHVKHVALMRQGNILLDRKLFKNEDWIVQVAALKDATAGIASTELEEKTGEGGAYLPLLGFLEEE
jgi:hypothetical protein